MNKRLGAVLASLFYMFLIFRVWNGIDKVNSFVILPNNALNSWILSQLDLNLF